MRRPLSASAVQISQLEVKKAVTIRAAGALYYWSGVCRAQMVHAVHNGAWKCAVSEIATACIASC